MGVYLSLFLSSAKATTAPVSLVAKALVQVVSQTNNFPLFHGTSSCDAIRSFSIGMVEAWCSMQDGALAAESELCRMSFIAACRWWCLFPQRQRSPCVARLSISSRQQWRMWGLQRGTQVKACCFLIAKSSSVHSNKLCYNFPKLSALAYGTSTTVFWTAHFVDGLCYSGFLGLLCTCWNWNWKLLMVVLCYYWTYNSIDARNCL